MKQTSGPVLLFPKKLPKTVRGLAHWNRKLLADAMRFEFKKRAVKAAIDSLNGEIRTYIPYLKDAQLRPYAELALRHLNMLKDEWQEELLAIKEAVRIIHDTNETLLLNVIKNSAGEDALRIVTNAAPHPETNLLHGQGWLLELLSADMCEARGQAAFLTFGTRLDPIGFDVVAVANPRTHVQWKLPPRRRRRSP